MILISPTFFWSASESLGCSKEVWRAIFVQNALANRPAISSYQLPDATPKNRLLVDVHFCCALSWISRRK